MVRSSLVPTVRILRPDFTVQGEAQTSVDKVASVLIWRTSKAGDEVLAVAALVTLASALLTRKARAHRLREFLLMVRSLPHGIIFHNGTRMADSPFRWAPITFMSRSWIQLGTTPEGEIAKCTTTGLKCNYLMLHLQQEQSGGR